MRVVVPKRCFRIEAGFARAPGRRAIDDRAGGGGRAIGPVGAREQPGHPGIAVDLERKRERKKVQSSV